MDTVLLAGELALATGLLVGVCRALVERLGEMGLMPRRGQRLR